MGEDAMTVAYKGMVVKESKEVFKPNPKSLDGVPDLCMLTYLGEENVLHNLDCRYKKQECYTSTTAKVLVAVNPYERMDSNYTEEVMTKYQNAPMNLEGLATQGDLPPHVFTVANAAYNNLIAWKKNQSIIVCGESGSGKTESAKYMMRFLAFTTTSTSLDPKEFAEAEAIGTQILDANPILESFGNAKTLLNNNSSRFGKFTKMLFEEAKTAPGKKQRRKLVGAMIETYLLEKSRVVRQDKGERNFHVFYQMTAVHADYPALKLGPHDQFHYVNQSGVHTLDDLRYPGKGADVEWHKELLQAFNTLLIPKDQQTAILKCVSGVLHLGNINFTQLKGEGSDIATPESLELSAEMFEVDVKGYTARLQTRSVPLPGGKTIIKPLNEPDAIFNRDSMARNLYNGLFRWIVWRINQQSNAQEGPSISWIGILDVFGFEIFENNSFEQFCINFANERLQQYFNEHVLKAEQDLYKKEALLWDPIDLPDNQDCIDLVMSKPYGILPILDSTCVQPKGTDEVFTANLFKAHKYHPRLRQMKQRKKEESDKQYETFNGFVVRHYAGAVIYDCANFLIKNADASEFDTLELFLSSKSDIASKILRIKADGSLEDTKRGFQRAFRSTGTVFSDQLSELMVTLRKTAPYFVRCIKPNPKKKPREFVGEYVRPQLRCGGLIEALRIIKLGFPTRCAYTRVHEIFHSLLKDKPVTNLNVRDFTEGIMRYMGSKTETLAKGDYQLGLTMVFFRPGRQTYLTDILEKKPDEVSKEDRAAIRKWLVKKRWVRGRGTVRAWLRCSKMVCEMRFKKAAISMVLIYRTIGRALKSARAVLGGKKEEEENARRMKDAQFQAALAAQQKLKALEEQKAKMDADWTKKEAENKRVLEERDAELADSQHKNSELNSQLKDVKAQLAESDSKRLQLLNSSKTQIMELQNKLMEEKNTTAQLKREQANDKQTIQDFEDQVKKNQSALDDLRRSLGLGKQEYETQLSDKDRLIAELRERIARLEQQLLELKEQSERTIRDLTEQLEQARNEGRETKNTLENSVREKESALARLQSEYSVLQETSDSNARSATDSHDATKEELRLTREKLSKNLEQKESELNEAKRELALLSGKLEAAQAAQAESAKALENATREHSERESEAKDRNDKQLKKLEAKVTELQSALAIATDRLDTLKKEQEGFKTQSDEAKSSLTRNLKDKESEVTELKAELQRTQAKFEALQTQFTERTAALQEEVNRARNDARDLQNKCDKELWEKNSDLSAAKSELALVKDRLTADKERAENALASTQSALDQEKKINGERQNKLQVELQAKTGDLKDLKAEFRNEKNEWRLKQEKYEKQVAQLESDLDTAQDELNMKKAKSALAEKEGKDASHETDSQYARKEAKWQAQVDDLRGDLKEVEDQLAKLRSEKNKALSDLENERDAWRDAEAKYKDDLTRALSDLDKSEKTLIDFRHQQAEEMEHRLQALQGQVSLLRNLTDDLKADKSEAKDRESSLSEQLKEAVAALAQTRSELKHLQASVNTERDKLRAEIDGVRESHSSERQKWKDEAAAHEKKLGEKTTQLTEMKAELHHLAEKESKAQSALKESDGETKEELHRLKLRNEELSAEQKAYLEKQNSYEQRLGKVTKDLLEAQAALSEVEHKRRSDGSRTEVEVLKAKLAASEKQVTDKNKSVDKQLQLIKDDWKREVEELKKQHEKELKNAEADQKSQNEAYKYKLQYLELSGGELQKERKRWQDKEREYEKALVSLTAELRELKYEHQQAVDLHESFRAHVDAKDSARQMESSNFDIKRQAIQAEHQLSLRQSETSLKAKIATLERENGKLRGELDDAQEEIERLTVALESGEERISRPEERATRPERTEYTSSRREPQTSVVEPTTQATESSSSYTQAPETTTTVVVEEPVAAVSEPAAESF